MSMCEFLKMYGKLIVLVAIGWGVAGVAFFIIRILLVA